MNTILENIKHFNPIKMESLVCLCIYASYAIRKIILFWSKIESLICHVPASMFIDSSIDGAYMINSSIDWVYKNCVNSTNYSIFINKKIDKRNFTNFFNNSNGVMFWIYRTLSAQSILPKTEPHWRPSHTCTQVTMKT